jgi:hypothetical protein
LTIQQKHEDIYEQENSLQKVTVELSDDYIKRDNLKVVYQDTLNDKDIDELRVFVKALNAKRQEIEK